MEVATIAANDSDIGELIAQAVEAVGQDGVITVEEAKSTETDLKVVEGMEVDKVRNYITTDEAAVLESNDSYYRSINEQDLLPSLDSIKNVHYDCAKDIEGEALTTLVLNVASKIVKAAAIKAPGFGDEQGEILDTYFGAQVLAKDRSADVKAQEHVIGREKVILGKIKQHLLAVKENHQQLKSGKPT